MPAVVCPSCRSKLKAPSKLAGRSAMCPKCQSPVRVPTAERLVAATLDGTERHRFAAPVADGDTVEARALDATAIQVAIAPQEDEAEAEPAPIVRRRGALFLQLFVVAALGVSGAFAVWMAISGASPPTNPSRTVQSRP
jgi:acetyl-CoA carboxylase beta subunit